MSRHDAHSDSYQGPSGQMRTSSAKCLGVSRRVRARRCECMLAMAHAALDVPHPSSVFYGGAPSAGRGVVVTGRCRDVVGFSFPEGNDRNAAAAYSMAACRTGR